MADYLVRVGVMGQIGRFLAVDSQRYVRGTSVICRTNRGLEFGAVLNSVSDHKSSIPRVGSLLRCATPEDHLLWSRIRKNRLSAFRQCEELLAERSTSSPKQTAPALMDVELLFDGKSVFFYFVGDIPAKLETQIEGLMAEMAEAYETKVQLRKFAEAMTLGCGPDCGTGASCGDSAGGGCGSCPVSSGCSSNSSASGA